MHAQKATKLEVLVHSIRLFGGYEFWALGFWTYLNGGSSVPKPPATAVVAWIIELGLLL